MALKLWPSASHIGTLVLPNTTAPALSQRSTDTAFVFAMLSRYAGTPQGVGRPATSNASLTVMGTPWSGPHAFPRVKARSAARARFRAVGISVVMMALSDGLYLST